MEWVSIYHYPGVAKYELKSEISGLNLLEHTRSITLNTRYTNAIQVSQPGF